MDLISSQKLQYVYVYEDCKKCHWTNLNCRLTLPIKAYSCKPGTTDRLIKVLDLRSKFRLVEVRDELAKVNGVDLIRPEHTWFEDEENK